MSKRKKTKVGNNPLPDASEYKERVKGNHQSKLDALLDDDPIPNPESLGAHRAAKASTSGLEVTKKQPQKRGPKPGKKPKRQQITVVISQDVANRMRDAVYWSPEHTVSSLVELAVSREIDQLEKKNGEPFKKRKGQVKTGRPVGMETTA